MRVFTVYAAIASLAIRPVAASAGEHGPLRVSVVAFTATGVSSELAAAVRTRLAQVCREQGAQLGDAEARVDSKCQADATCLAQATAKLPADGLLAVTVLRVGPMIQLSVRGYSRTSGSKLFEQSVSTKVQGFAGSPALSEVFSHAVQALQGEAPLELIEPPAKLAETPAQPAAPTLSATGGPSMVPYVLLGTSAAMLVGGAVLLLQVRRDIATVEHAQGIPWSEVAAANDRVPRRSAIGFALIGAGVLGVSGSVLWLSWEPSSGDRVALTLAPGMIAARGTF